MIKKKKGISFLLIALVGFLIGFVFGLRRPVPMQETLVIEENIQEDTTSKPNIK